MNFLYIFLGMILNIIAAAILALRYKIILAFMSAKLAMTKSFLVTCAFFALSYTSPLKLDSLLLKPFATKIMSHITLRRALVAFSFEFMYDTIFQIVLFLFLAGAYSYVRITNNFVVLAAIIVVLAVVVFALCKKISLLAWLFKKTQRFGINEQHMREILLEVRALFRPRLLMQITPINLLYALYIPITLWAAVRALSLDLPYILIMVIYWLSAVAGRFSGLPGGIGVRDATSTGLLILHGVNAAMAVQIAILYRIITIIPYLLIGLPMLFFLGQLGLRSIMSTTMTQLRAGSAKLP